MIEYLLLLLSIPVGMLLAWMARDELKQGRKWFAIVALLSGISGVVSYMAKERVYAFTLGFILVVSFISYLKSFDKARRKI